jgi:hypothetical protein
MIIDLEIVLKDLNSDDLPFRYLANRKSNDLSDQSKSWGII